MPTEKQLAIGGFQRVADGGACEFCQTVDGAFLYSDDVMPLHNRCGCGIEPVVGQIPKDAPTHEELAAEPAWTVAPEKAADIVQDLFSVDRLAVEALEDSDAATARFIPSRKAVAVHPDGSVQTHMNAVTHEYGHYIDRTLGVGDEYLTETAAGDSVYQLLRQSPTMEALRNDAFEVVKGDPVTRNYFLQGKEMFARAFHQYVALKSGDPDLMRELEHVRADKFLSFQFWQEDEFGPIAEAFDELFRERGLAK